MLACGVALVPCGFALGSIDLVRIGTLLGGVVLVAAAFAARRTLDLTVERVVRPARVQVDEPTTVTLVVAAPRGAPRPPSARRRRSVTRWATVPGSSSRACGVTRRAG